MGDEQRGSLEDPHVHVGVVVAPQRRRDPSKSSDARPCLLISGPSRELGWFLLIASKGLAGRALITVRFSVKSAGKAYVRHHRYGTGTGTTGTLKVGGLFLSNGEASHLVNDNCCETDIAGCPATRREAAGRTRA